jgi:hypothetical protein
MGHALPLPHLPHLQGAFRPQRRSGNCNFDYTQWFDLKYELDDHVHIDYHFIDIAVNGKKVFFDDSTLLEDVDLQPTDECFVLVRRQWEGAEQYDYKREAESSIDSNRN